MGACRMAAGLLPLLLAVASPAQAAQPAEDSNQTPAGSEASDPSAAAQAQSKDDWEFSTIGYAWFASAHGETDVIGPVEPVGLDLSFGDVLKAFKFAFMGAADVRKDRFVALGDLTFIHLEADEGIDIRDEDFAEAELDSRTSEVTLVAGYRVADKGPVIVDLKAGGRLNWIKTTLQLEGPQRSAEGSVKQTWIDPLIAGRVGAPLGGKWSAQLYGDIGGIVTGSDITWQLVAGIDYQLKPKMSIGGGYRIFKVHFDEGDFLYDVSQRGPMITFRTVF